MVIKWRVNREEHFINKR